MKTVTHTCVATLVLDPILLAQHRFLISIFLKNPASNCALWKDILYNCKRNCKLYFQLHFPYVDIILTADNFAMFFINTIKTITAQFSTAQSVKHILPANIHSFTSFSSHTLRHVFKLILYNHPTTCPLYPISSHLLQGISPAVVPVVYCVE